MCLSVYSVLCNRRMFHSELRCQACIEPVQLGSAKVDKMWREFNRLVLKYWKTLFVSPHLDFAIFLCRKLLHFNFTDFPVNFFKQFVSYFFWCLKQMLLYEIRPVLLFTLNLPRILHIISRKSWYSMQTKSWWWAVWKICVFCSTWFKSVACFIVRWYSVARWRTDACFYAFTGD